MACPSRTLALAAALLAACDSSGGGVQPVRPVSDLEPGTFVYLDSTLRVTFDAPIDPAALGEVSPTLIPTAGPGVGIPVRGSWRVNGSAVEFVPELAHELPVLTSCGLMPDTEYELRIRGGGLTGALRGLDGRPLAHTLEYRLLTRTGNVPREVLAHDLPGGPRLLGLEWTPRDEAGNWGLGSSHTPAVLRLTFDQPLDPGEANLPRRPVNSERGPIVLTYDDPQYGPGTWIAADCELERNTSEGATVALRPRGMLPSNAALAVRIASTLRDLLGEDNVGAFVEPVRAIVTELAFAPRHDALVLDFTKAQELGEPAFAEVPAVIEDGALRVPAAFPAIGEGVGDWAPVGCETMLHTDVQTLIYRGGGAKTFEGGVLQVLNLHIPPGCIVRGTGPKPLVIVVDGDARIEGWLSADGADAAFVGPYSTYRGPGDVTPPSPHPSGSSWTAPDPAGPPGGPAGGAGGSVGAFFSARESMPGESAPGTDGAGQGGGLGCGACLEASAGGGGSGAVQGDPWFPGAPGPGHLFRQRAGGGGATCGGALLGGLPGMPWFTNASVADDQWGRAYVPRTRRHVIGELTTLPGGSGGGSGGSLGWSSCEPVPLPFFAGGAGGGGGGVLVLKVRGRLTIGPAARISADGGDGFGFGNAYSPITGGGGGGSGGSVVLMAGEGIVLHAHGETFALQDYDFAVSADGGICVGSSFNSLPQSKYPANGTPTFTGAEYDRDSRGGFGGLGLVQLMVPVGRDNADGTNTVLDDYITVLHNGAPLGGIDKQRFLGWRGFPDENGMLVDDFGLPTDTVGGMGDIRPDPVLLPVPFATNGTARARSGWRELGALHRRQLEAPDGLPRGVVGVPTTFDSHARPDGWLPWADGLLGPLAGRALLPAPVAIAAAAVDEETLGFPVLALELAAELPATANDAYVGCVANLHTVAGGSHARVRVLHSTARALFVEARAAPLDGSTHVQLHAFFAELATLPPASYPGALGGPVPRANARIGFALHRAPGLALATGFDPERFPAEVGTFLYDLGDPAVGAALRAFGPRYLQWDILLDGEFRSVPGDEPPPAGPGSAIALRAVFVPVRF